MCQLSVSVYMEWIHLILIPCRQVYMAVHGCHMYTCLQGISIMSFIYPFVHKQWWLIGFVVDRHATAYTWFVH